MKLRTLALTAAAVVAATAASAADLRRPAPVAVAAAPAPDFSGIFGTYIGFGKIEDGDDNYRIGGVKGAVNFGLAGGFGLQISALGEIGLEADSESYGGVQKEVHLYMRDPSRYSLGLVGAVAMDEDDDNWNIHGLIGLNGSLYLGNLTLGLQGGYVGTFDTEGNDRLDNAWFVRGLAQMFLTPNLKLQVSAAYLDGQFDSDLDSFSGVTAGVEAAWKFARNTSVFGAVDGMWHSDDSWGGDFQTWQATAGLRVHFNQATLLSENRTGASFDTLNIPRLNSILARNN